MMNGTPLWRQGVICLSLANLVMMKNWLLLLPYKKGVTFWLQHSPTKNYLAAIVATVLVASIFGLGGILFRGHRYWWSVAYAATVVLALNGVRAYYNIGVQTLYLHCGSLGLLISNLVIILIFILVMFGLRRRWPAGILCERCALLLSPFILVTFTQAAMAAWYAPPEQEFHAKSRTVAPYSNTTHVMPVVWIIFDEFDYGVAFARRPPTLRLPNIDTFVNGAITCTQAFSPFDATSVSIPALLTGRRLQKTEPLGPSSMRLTERNGITSYLETVATIFSDMRQRNAGCAIFGWFFPYERLFSPCTSIADYAHFFYPMSERFISLVALQLRFLVETGYFSPWDESLTVKNHSTIYLKMQQDVLSHLRSGSDGLTFLHYPIPHSINIYDYQTQRIGANKSVRTGYLGNLALVDRTLGEIRSAMQAAGVWERSLVIVSSDHHWRFNTYDHITDKCHVPFMVKMPFQRAAFVCTKRFETVRTRELITDVIDGKLTKPETVIQWMGSREHPDR